MTQPAVEHHLRDAITQYLTLARGGTWSEADGPQRLEAVSIAVRTLLDASMSATAARRRAAGAKHVFYLSMEFLVGRALANNLGNLGVREQASGAVAAMHDDLARLEELESDAALGNGGLGRLAACFLDSMATLDLPGFGYGINYEFGLFKQSFVSGFQHEQPDVWNAARSPWLLERASETVAVPVYGRIEETVDRRGEYNPMWMDWRLILGVPSDMPIVGYGGRSVNALRLFTAQSSDQFDMEIFNAGDYLRAVEQKIASETVSKVLYPSDAVAAGRELRLVQEYFLVACALRDIVRRFVGPDADPGGFAAAVAMQLNDTHPSLMVAELMRYLIDERGLPWERAWDATVATLGYTNHTLLPEALEKWSVELVRYVLPRHLQIIFEINRRFLEHLRVDLAVPADALPGYSLIEEGPDKQVRMAHLAIVGSHSINGVAALHTELLKERVIPQFAALWPERFSNKTNGVTPRRWLLHCNPELAALLTEVAGEAWPRDLERVRALERSADAADVQDRIATIKRHNKERLATISADLTGIVLDPASLFDVQIKRIHEYKRQLLNVLHIVSRYLDIVDGGYTPSIARTFVFAGKAAPGYFMAKRIIKLVNAVGEMVNADPRAREWLRVVFLPDYRVTLAERIVPAADISEQISTAGKEASGTGNMKLAMNGALTVGTLDGANVEIMEAVGEDNIFIFGLTASQAVDVLHRYEPWTFAAADPRIDAVVQFLRQDRLGAGDLFDPILNRLQSPDDEYLHLADLGSYLDVHRRVDEAFAVPRAWHRMALLNIARMGRFSSDRAISEYARDVWHVDAC